MGPLSPMPILSRFLTKNIFGKSERGERKVGAYSEARKGEAAGKKKEKRSGAGRLNIDFKTWIKVLLGTEERGRGKG